MCYFFKSAIWKMLHVLHLSSIKSCLNMEINFVILFLSFLKSKCNCHDSLNAAIKLINSC